MVKRRTAGVVVLIIILIFSLYSSTNIFPNISLSQEINSTFAQCSPVNSVYYMHVILPWIDTFVYTIAPSIIITVCNILIILRLRQAAKQRRYMTNTESATEGRYGGRKIAIMLVTVSAFFVLTTLPLGILHIGKNKHC